MRFKFRLEKVKEAKETMLEVKQGELACALNAAQKEESRLNQIEGEVRSVARAVEGGLARSLNVDELEMLVECYHVLKQRRRFQAQRLQEALRQVEVKRGEVIEARRDVKTLENLHDRQYETFRVEELRREQCELDELGLRMRFAETVRSEGREELASSGVVPHSNGG